MTVEQILKYAQQAVRHQSKTCHSNDNCQSDKTCHSREGGNPSFSLNGDWMPAFAGMTNQAGAGHNQVPVTIRCFYNTQVDNTVN